MLNGRTVSREERQWHDTLADICGCICCVLDGHLRNFAEPPYVSIHHCDGRTKKHAHWYVLPLCAGHHQKGTDNCKTKLAIHGDWAEWVSSYGRPIEVLEACIMLIERAGRSIPTPVRALLAQWYASQQYQDHQNGAHACEVA